MSRMLLPLALIAAALAPADGLAQANTFGTVGLGRPVRPIDARSRAMGGSAAALHGGNLSAVNPASLARISTPGIWATLQPEKRTLTGELANGTVETAQFPLFRAVLPVTNRITAAIAFGNFLDRNWTVQFQDTLELTADSIPFFETRNSDGGISQLRLEFGGILSEKWTIGVGAQYYFGETRLTVTRAFAGDLLGYRSATAVQYKGWGLTLGGEFQPVNELIIGGVAAWGSKLDIRDDSTGAETTVNLPIALTLGASWGAAPDLVVALSGGWVNWSALNENFPEGGVADSYRLGGGLEARPLMGDTWAMFLRLGGSYEKYPFQLGGDAAWEKAVGLGAGMAFRAGRGRIDGSMEFGKRGDADTNGVEESFTRYTLSVAVFTN
jgi:hypothetical protein